MIIIPLSRNVFVHLYHCSTGNTINFELFIPTLVSPFQIPINFNAPWKPKDILEKQFLNGAKCIATRMFQSLSFDGLWNTFMLHTLNYKNILFYLRFINKYLLKVIFQLFWGWISQWYQLFIKRTNFIKVNTLSINSRYSNLYFILLFFSM